jgi:hypothetical protein
MFGSSASIHRYIAWLPEQLRPEIEALFAARQRIPQEALGLRVLTANVGSF